LINATVFGGFIAGRLMGIFDNFGTESGTSCRLELDLQSFSAP
jgi:hypothetical protein